jgi:aminopeptidase N
VKPFALLLALTVSTPALAQGQLSRGVVPVSYDITVMPEAAKMSFTGIEDIEVDVKEPTRTITLNAADLDVKVAHFDKKQVPFTLDAKAQTLTVTLPAAATAGRHTLSFAWAGKINTSAAGLFAIDYPDGKGGTARMLATQFEAPDARRFAPMWDEPSFKAKFKLTAIGPADQLAYSNMPATSVTPYGQSLKRYQFAESPVMSSYLLYLGMGDVERKTVMAGKTEVGVITRRGVVDQGDYALEAAQKLLAYYEDYFGLPYPLPKLDMIAGPGSSQFFGAMENWGAIFYFEPILLFDPKRSTVSDKQRIYTVVAHEVAHQWFGNIVTMRWWDDLWLNEGFASWMEGKATDDLVPEWKLKETLVATDREAALRLDATAATHPIIRKIETVDEISEAFDTITYQKGQAVITMLEAAVGDDKFRDGVRRYMQKYQYANTETPQLWAEIAAASGQPVASYMDSFTKQGGVPLISVSGTCAGGQTTTTLAQSRFGLDAASKTPQSWKVPVTLATLGGGNAEVMVDGSARSTVAGCGTLVANPGKGGYYRVRYDAPAHAAIVRDFARLSLADQLGTLGDDLALGYSGDQDLGRWFATVAAVKQDADPLVWQTLATQLSRVAGLYAGTPLGDAVKARSLGILAPALQRFGLEPKADDSPLVTNLRETMVALLGGAGDRDVLAAARRYVGALRTDPNAIPAPIRSPMLASYAVNATPAEWDALLGLARAETSPVVRNSYISLLGAARDEALAKRALDLVKATEFTAPQRVDLLAAVAGAHPELAFDFAVANAAMVNDLVEASSRAGFIVGLASGSNDPAIVARVNAYVAQNATAKGPADRTINAIRNRTTFADRLRPAVTKWAQPSTRTRPAR